MFDRNEEVLDVLRNAKRITMKNGALTPTDLKALIDTHGKAIRQVIEPNGLYWCLEVENAMLCDTIYNILRLPGSYTYKNNLYSPRAFPTELTKWLINNCNVVD